MDPNGIFATNNTAEIDVEGATLQGQIKCTYEDLIHGIGAPIESDMDYLWKVKFNDFTVASITGIKQLPNISVYWDIYGFGELSFTRASTAIQRSLGEHN